MSDPLHAAIFGFGALVTIISGLLGWIGVGLSRRIAALEGAIVGKEGYAEVLRRLSAIDGAMGENRERLATQERWLTDLAGTVHSISGKVDLMSLNRRRGTDVPPGDPY